MVGSSSLLILGLTLLAGGCYVAAYLAASDKVPVGTSVGGRRHRRPQPGHGHLGAPRRARRPGDTPFTVVLNGRTIQVRPQEVGLGVDYPASVHKAGAVRSWSPHRLWSLLHRRLHDRAGQQLDRTGWPPWSSASTQSDGFAPTDGGVIFHRDGFVDQPPADGLQVDLPVPGTAFWTPTSPTTPRCSSPWSRPPPTIDSAAVHRFVTHGSPTRPWPRR